MYVPRAFAVDDVPILHQQMLATPLPVLVTHASQGLIASHVPLLLNPDEGPYGTLYGHLARANPHCKALAEGVENLVIFAGEQAYISPSFYPSKAEHGKAVPTWNYLAVHAYGTAEVFDDAERFAGHDVELHAVQRRDDLLRTARQRVGERARLGEGHRQVADGEDRLPGERRRLPHAAPARSAQTCSQAARSRR